jgi:hypothetical protein
MTDESGQARSWKGQLEKNLEEFQIILLLISPSFLASDYFYCNRFMGDVTYPSDVAVAGAAESSVSPRTNGRSVPPHYAAARA